jgi:hypothetical protein
VCVSFQLLSFKLSSGYLFSPHQVNQGVVQKPTPQVTLYEPHTTEESLRRRRSGRNRWMYCHLRGHSPFFVIRLPLTSRTKYCVLLFDFSKTFLQVHVVRDFSLTDCPPACWVALAFLPGAPSPTVPIARFVCLGGITTVSHPRLSSPRVPEKKRVFPVFLRFFSLGF